MESVISQLQDFGMTLEEIEIFLNLQSKDSSFYSKKNITTTYNGNFAVMNANYPAVPQTNALTDYDGNPPKSVSDMQNRFQTVYNVAYNNFNTFRYTGPKETPEDYGNYAFYLYLSHYIDGPMRAPTANDLPEVISEQDVYVYDYFLKGSDLANYGRKISNFATTFYAIPGAKESALNLTTGLDRTVSENVSDFYNVCSTIEGGAEVALI